MPIFASAILAVSPIAANATPKHQHHMKGCHTHQCDVRVGRKWAQEHQPKQKLGQHYVVSSTCYAQSGTTASGLYTEPGMVANNFLPLGTHIVFDHPVFGRTEYVVEDHIGYGSELDIYNQSEQECDNYGRESLGFSVVE